MQVSKEKIILTVLSPCKQKVELTEVCKAGSHEPSLLFSSQNNVAFFFFSPVKLELSCRKLQLHKYHTFH